jgi:glycosyltransferase involved in cell wall biosynthesis
MSAATDLAPGEAAAPMGHICLITTEFHGLFKNGGIGTSNTGLALALAAAGYQVTVAFANADERGPRVATGNFDELRTHYAGLGITLDYVPPHAQGAFNDPRTGSYSIYLYVAAHRFDLVLFNDNGGQGYYTFQAKHAGSFPDAPILWLVTHGPFDWVMELNAMPYWGREPIVAGFMERRCAVLADRLISPSAYLIDWMRARGWTMPPRTVVTQNLVGSSLAPEAPFRHVAGAPATEIVFFGRQEVRKGLKLFCDAIDLLDAESDLTGLTITFLGKFSKLGALHSGIYLAERASRWRATLRIMADCDQRQALEKLARPGVLAVLPSLAENSPCTVVECLLLGVPFLATDSGGTAELINSEDHPTCLFAPDAASLAARLRTTVPSLPPAARLAISQDQTRHAWLEAVAQEMAKAREATPQPPPAGVSLTICLTHSQASPADPLLRAVLQEIRQAEDRPSLDILVAWDGQAGLESLSCAGDVPIRVITAAHTDLGGLRNSAAAQAEGDYLLFADPDGINLLPGAVATLARAARQTQADIVTALPDQDQNWQDLAGQDKMQFTKRAQSLPIGACAELGAFENCFGDGVYLVSRAAFRRSAGFQPGNDAAQLDWLFLTAAVLAGDRLDVVPSQLYEKMPRGRPDFDVGAAVLSHRRLMHIYAAAPAALFARMLETPKRFGMNDAENLEQSLAHVSTGALEIARQLAKMDPNKPEALRALIQYCCERRMLALALDLAMLDEKLHLVDATQTAARITGADALAALRTGSLKSLHKLDLTREAADRLRPLLATSQADVTKPPDVLATHLLGLDTVILKAAHMCPPGLVSLRAVVSCAVGLAETAQVALAICDPQSRLELDDQLRAGNGMAAWSGWKDLAPAGEHTELDLSLATPLGSVFDLYLLSRPREPVCGPPIRLSWQGLTAELQVGAGNTLSHISAQSVIARLSVKQLQRGELVTDVSKVPFPVYVPGARTMLHPLPRRIALVRLPAAFPRGSVALRARVCTENERAHPIDYAMWVLPAEPAPRGETDMPESEGFSGWHTVEAPAREPMDIYFATRISHSQNANHCHAFWHEFAIVDPAPTRRGQAVPGQSR